MVKYVPVWNRIKQDCLKLAEELLPGLNSDDQALSIALWNFTTASAVFFLILKLNIETYKLLRI